MDVTIVIVNWNGGELLIRCLQSIRNSRTSFRVQVIVVDNDSTDGSREAAATAFPEFRVMNSGSNLGFGRANNLARPFVQTPLVLFLNPDTELKENTLERAAGCLREHPDAALLGCKMQYPTGEVQNQGLQWHLTPWTALLELLFVTKKTQNRFRRWLPVMDPHHSAYVRKLYGGFVLARKEVLDRAGWFDERYFMYAEDADLSRTIHNLGWRLYYCSEAEIVHVCGGVSDQAPSGFSILMKCESISMLMRKYHGLTGQTLYRLVVLVGGGIRLLAVGLRELLLLAWFQKAGTSSKPAHLKHKLLVLWALGLKKPFVPPSPPAPGQSLSEPVRDAVARA